MGFDRDKVAALLADCHRRCCICHKFCGVKMETDHIRPKDDGGDDNIENAIPVCFECHAEIHSYNIKHPRGRKFTPDELRQHKDQWLKICSEHPEILAQSYIRSDVGPLNALIDELEFNAMVAQIKETNLIGCNFQNNQFNKAVQLGSISILQDELKSAINRAYVFMGSVNQYIAAASNQTFRSNAWAQEIDQAQKLIIVVEPLIQKAIKELIKFLVTEQD
ncbi:MAG: HNH endonuclease [Candidatus Thorarchaeota archaeon]